MRKKSSWSTNNNNTNDVLRNLVVVHRPTSSSSSSTTISGSALSSRVMSKSRLLIVLILTLIGIQVFVVQIIHGSTTNQYSSSQSDQSLLSSPTLLLHSDTSSFKTTRKNNTRHGRDYLKNYSTLDLYNPYYHPVIEIMPLTSSPTSSSDLLTMQQQQQIQQQLIEQQQNLKLKPPIKVGLVTILPLSGETKHFLYDGIQQSQYLELVGVVSLYNDGRNTNNNNNTNDDGDNNNNNIDNYYDNITILSSSSTTTNKNDATSGDGGSGYVVDPTLAQLWIVDGQRVAKLKNRQFLIDILQYYQHPSSSSPPPPSWKVLIIDYTDRFQFQLRHYVRLNVLQQQPQPQQQLSADTIGNNNGDSTTNTQQQQQKSRRRQDHVRLAVRSIVRGRYYDTTNNRIHIGQVMENIQTSGGSPTLHCPYAVRTDTVNAVRKVLLLKQQQQQQQQQQEQHDHQSKSTTTTANLVPTFTGSSRPLDVLHLWNLSSKEGKSQLRNSVSRAVLSWNGTTITTATTTTSTTSTLHTSIEERGVRRRTGRNTVNIEYVQGMLQSKIVIVTQKDDWEDHYRLFESLICGPLVITDYMLTLPRNLQNGTHLLMFTTIDELYHYIVYYLTHEIERQTIATNGYTIAMNQHRSWHRLEELIFGIPLTTSSATANTSISNTTTTTVPP